MAEWRLSEVRPNFMGGEILLWKRPGWIARAGRGLYSHVGMVALWDHELMVAEVREWHGGRCVTLESQVRRYPGKIDVYRIHPDRWDEVDYKKLMHYARITAGCDYGYWHVVLVSMLYLPFIRLFMKPQLEDKPNDVHPPFCSEAVANWYRWSGLDLVPRLADRLTEPSDIARSSALEFWLTLEGP